MSIPNDVWAEAPKEATHCSPATPCTQLVYWLVEDGVVKKVWVEYREYLDGEVWHEDQGYSCTNYTPDVQPFFDKDELIPRPTEEWIPRVGDTVLYKRTDSLDYAWDAPEKMEVVAMVGHKVWLKNALRDLVANLDDISPLKKEKSLREKLVEIMSSSDQQNDVDMYQAADRLIEAGVKLEEL